MWSETWREIWLPLIDHEGVPEGIFWELYRAPAPAQARRIAASRGIDMRTAIGNWPDPCNDLIRKRLLDNAIAIERALPAIPKQSLCSRRPTPYKPRPLIYVVKRT